MKGHKMKGYWFLDFKRIVMIRSIFVHFVDNDLHFVIPLNKCWNLCQWASSELRLKQDFKCSDFTKASQEILRKFTLLKVGKHILSLDPWNNFFFTRVLYKTLISVDLNFVLQSKNQIEYKIEKCQAQDYHNEPKTNLKHYPWS